MKIKDLPSNRGLGGVRFRYPGDGKLYYWHSQWQKGVWGKKYLESTQVFPLDCDDLSEAAEWEVVESKKAPSVSDAPESDTASRASSKDDSSPLGSQLQQEGKAEDLELPGGT